jgi:hypothetical protein
MPVLETILFRVIFFSILGTIIFFLLMGGYGVLRGLRIPVDWVTWIIGTLFMAASVLLCLSILLPNWFGEARISGNLLGLVSFLVAVNSASQWTVRRWYVSIKRRTTSLLVNGSRNILLFLRKHHVLFGWVVALTAIGHTVYYLPILAQLRQHEVITGFIALGILVLSVLLGIWIWLNVTVRKQRMPQRVHTIHSALAIAFFATLMVHMMLAGA